MIPRWAELMNSMSSSTSGVAGTSARIRSIACDVFQLLVAEQAERLLQRVDRLGSELAALQPDLIGAIRLGIARRPPSSRTAARRASRRCSRRRTHAVRSAELLHAGERFHKRQSSMVTCLRAWWHCRECMAAHIGVWAMWAYAISRLSLPIA